jgi:hypothetical protein
MLLCGKQICAKFLIKNHCTLSSFALLILPVLGGSKFNNLHLQANNSYDKEIGELVSLLQEENPLLSSPGPSTSPQQMDNPFGNVQIKPDYSMMDTSSNEGNRSISCIFHTHFFSL